MKRIGAVLVAFAFVLLAALPASASNYGSQGPDYGVGPNQSGVYLLPSATMTVKPVQLTANNRTALGQANTNSYVPTDLVVSTGANDMNCVTHRICVFDGAYGNIGWYGWNNCRGNASGPHPNKTCSQQHVFLNTSQTPPNRQRLLCHEVGHAVGLRHTSFLATCMTTEIDDGTSNTIRTNHEAQHLNAMY